MFAAMMIEDSAEDCGSSSGRQVARALCLSVGRGRPNLKSTSSTLSSPSDAAQVIIINMLNQHSASSALPSEPIRAWFKRPLLVQ